MIRLFIALFILIAIGIAACKINLFVYKLAGICLLIAFISIGIFVLLI